MIKREHYLKQVEPFIDKEIIKIITGIRRCGKSVFLKILMDELKLRGIVEDNIIYINLDNIYYKNIKNEKELDEIVLEKIKNIKGKIYLFIDEIQRVDRWESAINSYYSSFNIDIYLTGSVSNILSGKDSSYLSGRYIEIKMYPFSFKETLSITNSDDKDKTFEKYLQYGGMPFIFNLNDGEYVKEYLGNLYDSIILKDVVNQYNIRNVSLLEKLIDFIIDNMGRTFSAKSISDFLKHEKRNISSETIYSYLKYCENAFIINKVKREDVVGKKILKTQEKFYLTDHGFKEVIFQNNINTQSQILENIIFIEMLRRGYNVTIGKLYSKEIDFICKRGNEKIYIQVCSYLTDENTIKREFEPLLKVKDQYPKYVLSMDKKDMSYKGVKHLNIIDFLMD